jgi:virginiamycin B lyase
VLLFRRELSGTEHEVEEEHMNGVNRAIVASVAALAFTVAAAASASTTSSAALPRGAKVVARLGIPQGAGGLAVGEGAVWAMRSAVSTLMRIDPARNAVVARITVKPVHACPPFPASCGEAAAGDGSVWVSLVPDNMVERIDPQTNTVTEKIAVGPQPEGIAVSPGAVWVANRGDPSLSRIDPATNRVVATIPVGPASACCSDHMAVTAGGGAVWVTVPNLDAVVRIDPATNRVAATIRLSGHPCAFLVADARAVWAAGDHCTSVVTRIDLSTNAPTGAVKGLRTPIGLGLGFRSLWVADLDSQAIYRINPRTNRIVARLPVGGYPVRVAVGFGSVWIRDDSGRVLRIRPRA